ncbi:hypothetical protein DN412_38880 [Cupriavidus lacunae]|uniref:AAA domain-containing protein n=1 Tax=Cupriavidus lacunae TaxID=2666307 RepID=A0A370NHL3_9BURK|nr:hypothetical protein DN412_38880 [Cupriavidus lacunae]
MGASGQLFSRRSVRCGIDQAPTGLTCVIETGSITQDCISHTDVDGLDIILSDDPEGMLQHKLPTRADGMFRLARALAKPIMSDDNYDVVIIDTQGAAGHLQNNAALAASQIPLPVVPETLAARELTSGTLELLERLDLGWLSLYHCGTGSHALRADRHSHASPQARPRNVLRSRGDGTRDRLVRVHAAIPLRSKEKTRSRLVRSGKGSAPPAEMVAREHSRGA